MPNVKLFCLAHAGGSALVFSKWRRLLPSWMEICPLELNGRGRKTDLPFYASVEEAARDLTQTIRKEAGSGPFGLFGHSLGTVIAYELCRQMHANGDPLPQAAFFSGRIAPHLAEDSKPLHLLPEPEFLTEIKRLGLTSDELFEQPKLLQIFLPILRADFRLIETYAAPLQPHPLPIGFHVLAGTNDPWTRDRESGWEELTSAGCRLHELEGGHFFVYEQTEGVTDLVRNALLPIAESEFV